MTKSVARLLRWISPLVGLAAAVPAAGAPIAPPAAPRSWVRYAETARVTIAQWLESADAEATRFRNQFLVNSPQPSQSAPLILRLWIDDKGQVSRVDFEPFADAGMNRDLRAVIVHRTFGMPPPRGMRQPMNVAVQLIEGAERSP
jgi:hypothetical protein